MRMIPSKKTTKIVSYIVLNNLEISEDINFIAADSLGFVFGYPHEPVAVESSDIDGHWLCSDLNGIEISGTLICKVDLEGWHFKSTIRNVT